MDETIELGQGSGPLRGVRVVEIAGIGPAPHGCMILADLGADVVRIERPGGGPLSGGAADLLTRGRPNVALDLKRPDAVAAVLAMVGGADALVEGLRPGTLERLGLGPEQCRARNRRLIYARMTGWGQDGPWAHAAGHDLNYIAITGALHGCGQDRSRPHFPQNLLGDFGGGSTYLVIGVLAALLESRLSGEGQVIDAAIVDGTAHLNALGASMLAAGQLEGGRASGLLDGGVPYYDLYETADGEHISVAALEGPFYDELIERLGLTDVPDRSDPVALADLRGLLADTFRRHSRDHWATVFAGTDACVAPVLAMPEAPDHPHLRARSTFVRRDGVAEPSPAPRFSRTRSQLGSPPRPVGADTRAALRAWGVDPGPLLASGAAVQA